MGDDPELAVADRVEHACGDLRRGLTGRPGEAVADHQPHRLRHLGAVLDARAPRAGRAPTPSPWCRPSSGTGRSRRSASRRSASSCASVSEIDTTATLVAQYGPMNATPLSSPPIDAVLTMWPGVPCSRMIGRNVVHPVDDAPEVDVDDPLPVVERLVAHQVERRDAGVVAQHVDASEPLDASSRPGARPRRRRTRRRRPRARRRHRRGCPRRRPRPGRRRGRRPRPPSPRRRTSPPARGRCRSPRR